TVTVRSVAPAALTFRAKPMPFPGEWSETQMLAPSNATPKLPKAPVVTVVTVHGIDPGVMIETEPLQFAVQIRAPSKVIWPGLFGRLLATVCTVPADCEGSIR